MTAFLADAGDAFLGDPFLDAAVFDVAFLPDAAVEIFLEEAGAFLPPVAGFLVEEGGFLGGAGDFLVPLGEAFFPAVVGEAFLAGVLGEAFLDDVPDDAFFVALGVAFDFAGVSAVLAFFCIRRSWVKADT